MGVGDRKALIPAAEQKKKRKPKCPSAGNWINSDIFI